MKPVKIVYLMLALVLPVSIFLFLKYFGENKFSVEPFFKNGVESNTECPESLQGQYYVSEDILIQLRWSEEKKLTLFYCPDNVTQNSSQLTRIGESIDTTQFLIIKVVPKEDNSYPPIDNSMVSIQSDSLNQWKKCALFLKSPYDLILIDNQRRIRGYYQLSNREEVDRLLLEIKIILMD